ncbi:MAG: preprotein translocase subunit SecY [Bacillota bacterium]
MFKTLINAWKVKDIRSKILYTLLLVLIYRLGSFIPVPGVNTAYIAYMADQYDILSFLNLLSGGAFGDFTIFAMGITPYITASIIIQLLAIAVPALERLSKEEDGKQKMERITRYTGVALAFIQSVGIVLGLGQSAVLNQGIMTYLTIGVVSTAGTAFLMWMGERITEKGVGNGISLLIFTSIAARVPITVINYGRAFFDPTYAGGNLAWWVIPIILLMLAVLITGVVFIDKGVRKIPVQYAKRVVGRKMYGGQTTHIPMKANANGVMPLIFAMTLIQFPGMIAQFWPDSGFYDFYVKYLGTGTWIYYAIYALLIIAFAYFYTTISFNPIEISKNLQQYGGFIPGIRPGRATSDYLSRISSRLTLFGALFLAVIAIAPTLVLHAFGTKSMFGPTSLLIMVNVALETSAQLESQMLMRHYKGFLG